MFLSSIPPHYDKMAQVRRPARSPSSNWGIIAFYFEGWGLVFQWYTANGSEFPVPAFKHDRQKEIFFFFPQIRVARAGQIAKMTALRLCDSLWHLWIIWKFRQTNEILVKLTSHTVQLEWFRNSYWCVRKIQCRTAGSIFIFILVKRKEQNLRNQPGQTSVGLKPHTPLLPSVRSQELILQLLDS